LSSARHRQHAGKGATIVKAVVLRSPRQLELVEVPKPVLRGKNDVLLRVEACGICGSDLRYWNGDNPWALHTLGRHVPNPPNIILGHEYAGVVVAVNSPEYEPLIGTRVGAQAFRVCGACAFCRSNREHLCRGTVHMGHGQGWGEMDVYPGAYAEYCLAWGDLVYPIPDCVPMEQAAMADVVCVAVHVVSRAERHDGDVLCIGGGPVGLSIAQVARVRGAARVFVSEPAPSARSVLANFDYIKLIDPGRDTIQDALGRYGVQGVSAIYDTIGAGDTIAEAVPLLEECGTYVNVAVHDTPVHLNAASLGSERTITSSSNATYADVRQAYELICSGHVNVGPMITHRLPLEQYATAFDLLLRSPKEAFKIILEPGSNGRPLDAASQEYALQK
jgi:2-desacetyl-2-hydroxyethyl bacteriochlorophyllide A dehydrogenase